MAVIMLLAFCFSLVIFKCGFFIYHCFYLRRPEMSECSVALEEVLAVAEETGQYTNCQTPCRTLYYQYACDNACDTKIFETLCLLYSDTYTYESLYYQCQ